MRCCVVMPAYNEAQHLARLVPQVFAQQAWLPECELWLLVVDDNSPDATAEVLAKLAAEYPRLRVLRGAKQGLGVAYRRGFAYALDELQADRLVQMDGDWQHDPAALPFLVQACGDDVAGVVGSRFAPGGTTPAFSWRRRWTSQVGNWLIHHMGRLPHLYDYTSGYRCLNAKLAVECVRRCQRDGLAVRGYAFQSSLMAELLRTGMPVRELPIVFGQREHGESKLGRRDYWEFLLNLWGLRKRSG